MHLIELLASNPLLFAVASGVLGLLIGSFLNVVIYRLPVMLERGWKNDCEAFLADVNSIDDVADAHNVDGNDNNSVDGDKNSNIDKKQPQEKIVDQNDERFDLIKPDSHCPKCQHKIAAWENIPVVSYLLLGAKCRACKSSISIRYPLVELLTGTLSFWVALHFGFGAPAMAALFLTWVLIALAMIDYDTQLLPDVITQPVLWVGLLLSLWGVFVDSMTSIIGAACGYMVLWLVFQAFRLLTGKEGMGFGDFKLLALLGAWLGWQMLPAIILLSSLAGAVIGISLMIFKQHNKEKPIPFGPYLAIAGWLALMWGQQINQMYLGTMM